MLLDTPAYLLFLALVFLAYWRLPQGTPRKVFLLGSSYLFYASIDWRLAGILLALTAVIFVLARGIRGDPHPRIRTLLGIGVSLGTLVVFKYEGFFLPSVHHLMDRMGIATPASILNVVLPVGISFFTFQAIAYVVDVYKGRCEPVDSWLDFAVYLAFFPKLIAGPIVRPRDFLRQLKGTPAGGPEDLRGSMSLVLVGLFKKIVIADSIASLGDVAIRAASRVPGAQPFPTPVFLVGFYLYAIQIYADFSGYTDIARGSAALLGFELPPNFRRPYFASTIGQFWDRWHMSLTQWFREYIFFPLSRTLLSRAPRLDSRIIRAFCTLATMVLIGLWHGAAWTFVVWGAYHGILLVLGGFARLEAKGTGWRIVGGLITFHLVGIGWIVFASESLAGAFHYLGGILTLSQMHWIGVELPPLLVAGGLMLLIDLAEEGWLDRLAPAWRRFRPALVFAATAVVATLVILGVVRGEGALPFLYGRF